MAQDYNSTLNLPATEFPMRGNLPKREPETLKKWEDERLYYKMIEKKCDEWYASAACTAAPIIDYITHTGQMRRLNDPRVVRPGN